MITASIVLYNTSEHDLSRLLRCVFQSSIGRIYIIDHSPKALRTIVPDDDRIVYKAQDNLGYGAGHNVAIKCALSDGADYHVVLNPDVYWTDIVIEKLSTFMDNNRDVGLVMPKIVYPNGDIQYLCKLLPTPIDLIIRRFMQIKAFREKLDYKYELQWTGYDKIMEVPSLSGCFMFMRCSILRQVDGFDERYFMYAEDLDLCRRIGEISRTMFFSEVSVVHEYEKGSYKSKKLLKYHITSIIKYFNKWGWIFDKKRNLRNHYCISQFKSRTTT